MPSRQINDFFTKWKQKKIEVVAKPDLEQTEQEEQQAVEVKPKLIKDENGVVKVESNPAPSRGARILRCTICRSRN